MKEPKVTVIDIGDRVNCDLCNAEYTADSPESGGILVGSYVYCPKCEERQVNLLREYNETHLIRERCPPGMRFHAWVMQLRGGDNTITLTSFDVDDP
jgi:hypothetical protein